METLGILLGTVTRVKLMRLFLFNTDKTFSVAEIVTRIKTKEKEVKEEVSILEKAGLIRKKVFFVRSEKKVGKKVVSFRKKEIGWYLNTSFVFLSQFQNLLTGSKLLKDEEILKRLAHVGKLKLVILAGVFIQNWTSRVDIFVVGDNLKKNSLENIVRTLESEIGREITYTYFETADFKYRLAMCDKLVRDVLDYPHNTILDKLGESEMKKIR